MRYSLKQPVLRFQNYSKSSHGSTGMASNPTVLKMTSIVGTTLAVLLADWFYLLYITSHGFETKTQELMLGSFSLSMTLQWLPILGIIIVSLVAWYEASSRIFPRRGGLESEPLATLRLVRAIAISFALFVCILYIPYLIGSNWFWARLSEMSKNFTQVRDFAQTLLNTDETMMSLNPLWQYSLSQVLATSLMLLGVWIFGRVPRRPRRQR